MMTPEKLDEIEKCHAIKPHEMCIDVNPLVQEVRRLTMSLTMLQARNKSLRDHVVALKEELEVVTEELEAAKANFKEEREDIQTDYLLQMEAATFAKDEAKKLREALKGIYDLWPYINCVCGRNQARMGDDRRKQIRALIEAGGEE